MATPARSVGSCVLWALLAGCPGCGPGGPGQPAEEVVKVPGQGSVVVYVEAPERTAGPLLKTFQDQTGISVSATYREILGERFATVLREDAVKGKVDLFWGETPLSACDLVDADLAVPFRTAGARPVRDGTARSADRESTRLNSSHLVISYAAFCFK